MKKRLVMLFAVLVLSMSVVTSAFALRWTVGNTQWGMTFDTSSASAVGNISQTREGNVSMRVKVSMDVINLAGGTDIVIKSSAKTADRTAKASVSRTFGFRFNGEKAFGTHAGGSPSLGYGLV